MTVTSLADCLHLEKSTASRLAKGLLARGLIRKRSPTSDDRKVILQLTEAGMRLARKVFNDSSEEFVGILESLDPESGSMLPPLMGELSRAVASVGDARRARGG
jgi:DNA-binding MarR family transcriptional regulator